MVVTFTTHALAVRGVPSIALAATSPVRLSPEHPDVGPQTPVDDPPVYVGQMTDYVTNRGLRIAYDVAGGGDEAVVLLRGLGQRRSDWASCGYVDVLAERSTVVCVDSLGHGDSDSPLDCSLYSRSQRAGEIVAVLAGIGVPRAHVVGYSMGGWLASAVLVHAPECLRSVCFGGWDPVGGMAGIPSFIRSKLGRSR